MLWNCELLQCETADEFKVFEDCLLFFVCLESKDTQKTIQDGLRRVIQLNRKRFKKNILVLFPFAHLSHDIMPLNQAEILYDKVVRKLQGHFLQLWPMAFNKNKRITIKLLPENKDVSFIEY